MSAKINAINVLKILTIKDSVSKLNAVIARVWWAETTSYSQCTFHSTMHWLCINSHIYFCMELWAEIKIVRA